MISATPFTAYATLLLTTVAMADVIPVPAHQICDVAYTPIPESCQHLGTWQDAELNPRYEICVGNLCVVRLIGDLIPTWDCVGTPLCIDPRYRDERLCEPSLIHCRCEAGWKMLGDVCKALVCGEHVVGESWSVVRDDGEMWYTCQEGGKIKCSLSCTHGFPSGHVDPCTDSCGPNIP